jgi:hypothetical protein
MNVFFYLDLENFTQYLVKKLPWKLESSFFVKVFLC